MLLVLLCILPMGLACSSGEWACLDGRRCIEEQQVCDRLIHCRDGSDEKQELCNTWICAEDMWKCGTIECIPRSSVCARKDLQCKYPAFIDYDITKADQQH